MAPVAKVTKLRSGKSKTSFLSNRAVLVVVVVGVVAAVAVVGDYVGVVDVLVVRQLVTRDFRLRKKSKSHRTIFNLNKNVML